MNLNRWLSLPFALAPGLLAGCDIFDSKLVQSCEAVIKDRLRSPSEYKRIEVEEYKEKLSFDEANSEFKYMDYQIKSFKEGKLNPTKFIAVIKYDAANAFGTPIRSASICTYISSDESDDRIFKQAVTVDGFSSTQWLAKQILESQDN